MSSHGVQFVHQSLPGDINSKRHQQQVVRSNAARAAHAEARRLRTIRYQVFKAQERSQLVALKSPADAITAPKIDRVLSASRKDPFTSFVRPFKPVEHFLLDHFIRAVVPLIRCHELAAYYTERMTRAWVPLALTDAGLLNSIFLTACRHLSANYWEHQQQQQHFADLSVRYKLECLRSLREAVSSKTSFDDATVANAVMLVYDELAVRDIAMAKRHLEGAVRMVTINGGPQSLGLDGFIDRLMSNLVSKFGVLDLISQ